MGRVIERAALVEECARLRVAGQRVVLTNGVFDLLHVGHARSLQAARALGDRLVVGINDDASVRRNKGPLRPIVPAAERAELVAALACVDYAVIFGETTAAALVTAVQPAVYVKGGDYAAPGVEDGKPLPETAAVLATGGTIHIVPLEPNASSTGLIERVLARYQATPPAPGSDRET
ncbi:MAG: adenylyltransferase/cytidyltransferase family protein [Chloroflexi bacterium]|nr:adenylyltransferase/cytidyltransferase family protein [Chloroflexota bacterium]